MRRTASTYSFDGRHVAEYLHGPSPVIEVDGDKQYTVDNIPKNLKKTQEPLPEIRPPELGENPTCFRKFRVKMYIFVGSTMFEGFITACIMLNTVAMACEHHNQPKIMDKISNILNYVCIALYIKTFAFVFTLKVPFHS